MAWFHPGQLSFLLWSTSDTLPTKANLRWCCMQSDVYAVLYVCPQLPTGCSVVLTQQCYTYQHEQVLHVLVSIGLHSCVCWPTRLKGKWRFPGNCILLDLPITSYRPEVLKLVSLYASTSLPLFQSIIKTGKKGLSQLGKHN